MSPAKQHGADSKLPALAANDGAERVNRNSVLSSRVTCRNQRNISNVFVRMT